MNFENILIEIIKYKPKTKAKFDDARRKVCGQLKTTQPSNRDLLQAYQILVKKKRVVRDETLERFMRKADIRTLSGVAIITSLCKPYNCPGKCVYCPNEARMPKSYLSSEPAAARALNLKFDPYEQMQKRIEMLRRSGHPTDKIAKHKIIGLTLETRPDAINPTNIYHMRQQGCTRIELGLQAPDDKILKLVQRGHTVQQFRDAMTLLRSAGFKVDLHFMPDLPGTTAKHDVEMYKSLFTDPGFKPDMVKIYPCTVIKSAPLYNWYKDKKYKPYGNKKLFQALIEMKTATPRYCRISRLIRDIPTNDITAGNMVTNLREYLAEEMKKQGLKCNCLRCREVGHNKNFKFQISNFKLFVDEYQTIGGKEYFLSYEDKDRTVVYGFLRLRLPDKENSNKNLSNLLGFSNLSEISFIRELHTYGQLLDLGTKSKSASQHKGLGKKLVLEAEKISKKYKYKKIAIISGVGVRGYYRKLGYRKKGTYMFKSL